MPDRSGFPVLEQAEDGILVVRAVEGDVRAFEVLMRRHGPLMRAYAIRLLGSNSEADDVVQEAFITAWEQLSTLNNQSAVRAWLMRVVSRKSIDLIRARKPQVADVPEDEVPAPASREAAHVVEVRSAVEALSAALRRLPSAQHECWLLREVGGYSYDEIAEELRMSRAVVRGTLARARATLIREMEAWR